MKECSILRANRNKNKNLIKVASYVFSIAVWIVIWHIAAARIDSEIFLPAPGKVFSVLVNDLLPSEEFRGSLFSSIIHIGQGFIIGALFGIILAVFATLCEFIKVLLWLPIKVLKSVPVASFVILTLLWFRTEQLAIVIPAMIVLPTLYINTITGIEQTDYRLLQMAAVYRVPIYKKVLSIYIPNTLPYVLSACSLAIGMAWKSGIAAEIIGLAKNSIGNELYKAKLYLMIPELFAWTIVIVILSVVCEGCIKFVISIINEKNLK